MGMSAARQCGKLFAVTALSVAVSTLVGNAAYAPALEFFLPALIFYALIEESARVVALFYASKQHALRFWTTVWSVGAGFAIVEISNAFFPDQYSSEEARNAPFALLAAFEFLFGFLLHGGLTAVMLALKRRFGWVLGFAATLGLHVLWNVALGA